MRRHQKLIPLSRFHRSCLFVALMAKENAPDMKGYSDEIPDKINYAVSFYQDQLKAHFEVEQELWNQVSTKSEKLKIIIDELTVERLSLSRLFQRLAKIRSEKALNEVGDLLERHIRKEERVLFQQIQNDLSEQELVRLPF